MCIKVFKRIVWGWTINDNSVQFISNEMLHKAVIPALHPGRMTQAIQVKQVIFCPGHLGIWM